jgi:hypothetical protein
MAEVGGITELQMLQAEAAILKKTLNGVSDAGKTSESCSQVLSAILAAAEKDYFLVQDPPLQNKFHTSAGQPTDSGCCVVL